MKILVTGAKGFLGKNLAYNLNAIKEGKNRTRNLFIEDIYEYDIDSSYDELVEYVKNADFIFDFAGVNRPQNIEEFMEGNYVFTKNIIDMLETNNHIIPIMYSSSIQASLMGRFENSEYGKSKLAAEKEVFEYANRHNILSYVYRFTNVFGKWCRPNYNSVIATFCHNIANDLSITINDEKTELELLYIDDLVEGMLDALEGKEIRCNYDGISAIICEDGRYCYIPKSYKRSLGEIAGILKSFENLSNTINTPEMLPDSFEKKLFSTYLSYLPQNKVSYSLKMNCDQRGSFTELIRTKSSGQISVNISKPGITKGEHWHNSKHEIFIVVSGHGLIQERCLSTGEIVEIEVFGEQMTAVRMLPGYTHNIINMSETEDLVTVMWANEEFDMNKPDTFSEKV